MRTAAKVRIAGTGSYVPDRILDNEYFTRIVDTSDAWIIERTGVKERRIAPESQCTSDLAAEAARRALAAAGRTPQDVELIILATSTPDRIVPPTSVYVQKKLEAWNAGAVDHIAACSGYVYALSSGWNYVANRQVRNCLVIGSELLTRIANYTDRSTCILFGDAAGALLLEAADDGSSDILYSKLAADGRGEHLIIVPAGGTALQLTDERRANHLDTIQMQGREVYKFAITKFVELIQDAVKALGVTTEAIDALIPHQVNLRIIESAADKLKIPMSKIIVNIDRYGNTSAASIPVAIDEGVRAGRIQRGHLVVAVAFGAGLTWGSVALRW
ncbi:MAG: ketoacyl-ACP synthase III [Planctomycetes bacterium]|nr:ketoacyl-ACP synthase III [Planctomycetota bacterium]